MPVNGQYGFQGSRSAVQTIQFSQLKEGDRFILAADLGYSGGVAIRVKTGEATYRFEDGETENKIFHHINVVNIIKLKD